MVISVRFCVTNVSFNACSGIICRPQNAVHVHNTDIAKIDILFSKTESHASRAGNIGPDFTLLPESAYGLKALIIWNIDTPFEKHKYRKNYAIIFASFCPIDPGDAGRADSGSMGPDK